LSSSSPRAGIASGVTDETVKSDLFAFQENSPTNGAYEALKAAWDAMRGPDRAGILQRGYSNCSKDCSTFALDTLGGRAPPAYIAAHATHNPYLAAVIGGKG
jgi:hypothetical protein